MPVAQVDLWVQRLRWRNLSPHTISNYASAARRFLAVHSLDTSAPEIERYLTARHLSPASYGVELERLRAFFKWCVSQKLVRENPCAGVEKPKKPLRYRPAPTLEEFQQVAAAAQCLEERLLVSVLFYTGLRVSEARSLRVCDLDLPKRRALVMGKGAKERQVVYTEAVAELLRFSTSSRLESDWVFPGRRGSPRSFEWLEATCRRLGVLAGLRYRLTAHVLRHGWVRLMKSRGVPLEVTQRLAGHSDIVTTARLYGRLDTDDLQATYDAHIGA